MRYNIEPVGDNAAAVMHNKNLIQEMIQRDGHTGYFTEAKPPAGIKHIGSQLVNEDVRHYYYNAEEDRFYAAMESELRFRQEMLAAVKRVQKKSRLH